MLHGSQQELQLLLLLQLDEDNISRSSSKKLELVLRSVSVADERIEISNIRSTSLLNKFIKTPL